MSKFYNLAALALFFAIPTSVFAEITEFPDLNRLQCEVEDYGAGFIPVLSYLGKSVVSLVPTGNRYISQTLAESIYGKCQSLLDIAKRDRTSVLWDDSKIGLASLSTKPSSPSYSDLLSLIHSLDQRVTTLEKANEQCRK